MSQHAGDGDPAQRPPPPPQHQQSGDSTVSSTGAVNGELDGALPPALADVNTEHSPVSGSGGGGPGSGSRGGGDDSPVVASAGSSPADSTESMGDDSTTVRQHYPPSSRGTGGGRGGGGRGRVGDGPLEGEEEEDEEDRQLKDRAPVDDGRCVCVVCSLSVAGLCCGWGWWWRIYLFVSIVFVGWTICCLRERCVPPPAPTAQGVPGEWTEALRR